MLALTRKIGQSLMIGEDIEITIVEVRGDQVKLAIQAPKEVAIHRKEIYEQIIEENRRAVEIPINMDLSDLIGQPQKKKE